MALPEGCHHPEPLLEGEQCISSGKADASLSSAQVNSPLPLSSFSSGDWGVAGLPGSSHLPTFSLGLSLQAQLSRACPGEGIFSPSRPSSPSCYLVSASGLSLFLLVHRHQRCISVLKLWTQLLHCCRFQSSPVTLTFFFLQHQKLLMHNSTNNPEMHQNSNDSHQRELDVKHCLLKIHSIHADPGAFIF